MSHSSAASAAVATPLATHHATKPNVRRTAETRTLAGSWRHRARSGVGLASLTRGVAWATSLLALLAVTGCGTPYQLQLKSAPLIDKTSRSPELADKNYRKVMVIPPSGSGTEQFDSKLALFEAELLKINVTVISGAVTGRVVTDSKVAGSAHDGAAKLSDIERALVMAKKTGADAVIQIGSFGWSKDDAQPYRYFVEDAATKSMKEVDEKTFASTPSAKRYQLRSPKLSFVGRLVDVESGQVMAAFNIVTAANRCMSPPYEATLKIHSSDAAERVSENYSYSQVAKGDDTRERCMTKVIKAMATVLAK